MKITLCGSTRFYKDFAIWNSALSLGGHVVHSISMAGRQEKDTGKDITQPVVTDAEKITLDLIHLAKIEESDAILVINVGGYIGESTRREIAWAKMRGKEVYWLVNSHGGEFLGRIVWQIYTTNGEPIATIKQLDKYREFA